MKNPMPRLLLLPTRRYEIISVILSASQQEMEPLALHTGYVSPNKLISGLFCRFVECFEKITGYHMVILNPIYLRIVPKGVKGSGMISK